jgi:hypothetical protein
VDTNASKCKSTYPGIDASTSSGATPNSYFVENGTYVSMRNAQIGYSFNLKRLKKGRDSKTKDLCIGN